MDYNDLKENVVVTSWQMNDSTLIHYQIFLNKFTNYYHGLTLHMIKLKSITTTKKIVILEFHMGNTSIL